MTSSQPREQRLVFGEVAERYDRARPTYPTELVGDVAEILGLPERARVLEVGTGTGKATVLWAGAGYEVLGLEPSEEMAAIARRKFAGRGTVTIETTGLEVWEVEPEAFDLVTAAQAWHWVDREIGFPKAHDALRPGGGVALFWNWERERPTNIEVVFDDVYRRVAPELVKEPLKHRVGEAIRDELAASPHFGDVTVRRYPWEKVYTPETYVDLLGTHSDHRMLPDDHRERLHDGVAAVIDGLGGSVTIGYTTEVLIAARA
ncbi:MAG: class I SAM-dependent methyltransferase [Acidimicrobiia bacterium]